LNGSADKSALYGPQKRLATVREKGKLHVVAFGREVRIVPGQPLAVSLRG
jgi:hypothetical protein